MEIKLKKESMQRIVVALDFVFLQRTYYKERYGTQWFTQSQSNTKCFLKSLLDAGVNEVWLVENNSGEVGTMLQASCAVDKNVVYMDREVHTMRLTWLKYDRHPMYRSSSCDEVSKILANLTPPKISAHDNVVTYLRKDEDFKCMLRITNLEDELPVDLSCAAKERLCDSSKKKRKVLRPYLDQLYDSKQVPVYRCICGDFYQYE